jgi:glycine betaine/proline transport system substrate-binding protein
MKISAFLILLIVFSSITSFAEKKETDEIVIIENNWTSQIVLSRILAKLFDKASIKSKFTKVETKDQWGQLARGWGHIQVEVWQGTMEKMLKRLIKKDKVIMAGTHDAETREDWWYPTYMEKVCPGLPDWKALKKCSKVFATISSNGKGRYLGGPWEKPDKARVRALGLDFIIERAEKGDDLWLALEKAYKKKKPIILFNWTPSWVESKYKGKFINFPDYDLKCETDATWGINKKWKFDCGNPKKGWLKKLAWKGLEEKSPCALKILKNFNLNNKMIADAAFYVDSEKLTYNKAASKWLMTYKKKWNNWIPKECLKQN